MFREYDNIKTNMTDEELVLIPTKDLNKVVKESGESYINYIWVVPDIFRQDNDDEEEDDETVMKREL